MRRITSAPEGHNRRMIPRKLRLRRNQTSAPASPEPDPPSSSKIPPRTNVSRSSSTRRLPTYSSQRSPAVRKASTAAVSLGIFAIVKCGIYAPLFHKLERLGIQLFMQLTHPHRPVRHPYVNRRGRRSKNYPSLPTSLQKAPPVRKSPPAPCSAALSVPRSGRGGNNVRCAANSGNPGCSSRRRFLHETLPPDLSRRPPTHAAGSAYPEKNYSAFRRL